MDQLPVQGWVLGPTEKLGYGDAMYSRNGKFCLYGTKAADGKFRLRLVYRTDEGKRREYWHQDFPLLAEHHHAYAWINERGFLSVGNQTLINEGDTMALLHADPDLVCPSPNLALQNFGNAVMYWKRVGRNEPIPSWSTPDGPDTSKVLYRKCEALKGTGSISVDTAGADMEIKANADLLIKGEVVPKNTYFGGHLKKGGKVGDLIIVISSDHISDGDGENEIPTGGKSSENAQVGSRAIKITSKKFKVDVRGYSLYIG